MSSRPGEGRGEPSVGKLTGDNWYPLNIACGTRTVYPGERNKGLSLTFQPPEEGRIIQWPKRCDKHGNKDEDNSPKNVNNLLTVSEKKSAEQESLDLMSKVQDCSLDVNEFKLQWHYYVHFWTNTLGKGMNPLISPPS